jgi:hypothetical protein
MAETPQERAEAARVRRRWLTLGEVVAIAAVLISALTFWNSWRERQNSEAERAAESVQSQRKASMLLLNATPDKNGRRLSLTPRADSQAIQNQVVYFPAMLKVDPAQTSGDARIERDWFGDALVDARDDAKIKDGVGDSRLPVLIETRYLTDGDPHVDRTIYEVGYATEHGLFGGTSILLRGLSRVGPVTNLETGQARINALAAGRLKPARPAPPEEAPKNRSE